MVLEHGHVPLLRLISTNISTPSRAPFGCERVELAVAVGRQLFCRGKVWVRHFTSFIAFHQSSLKKLLTTARLVVRRVRELLRAQLQMRAGRLIAGEVAAEELSFGRSVAALAILPLLRLPVVLMQLFSFNSVDH